MIRLVIISIFTICCLTLHFTGQSQITGQAHSAAYSYHHPSKDKQSWQRLNLLLSSTFIVVAREGQVEHDTCLYIASRSLGVSRYAVLAEGIYNDEVNPHAKWIDQRQPAAGVRLLSEATGRKRVQLLTLIGAYYAFEPHSYQKYKDSVEYYLRMAVSESKKIKEDRLGRQALCVLGKIYVQAADPKGDAIFSALIEECRKNNDKETEARAIAYRGIFAAPTPATFMQKITDLQTASELYHSLQNAEQEINVLMDLGYMSVVSGQFQTAYDLYLKALALADKIQFPYTHYITHAITAITAYMGKFGEPLRYSLQTIKVSESCRDSIGWGYFYSHLSELYNLEGRKEEEISLSEKAVDRFVKDKNPSVYAVLNTVIDDMCNNGRAEEALRRVQTIAAEINSDMTATDLFCYNNAYVGCYLGLNKLDLAEKHIRIMDSLETIAENIRGPLRRSLVTDGYAHIYLKRGNYRKAREYFEKQFTTTSYGQRTLSNDLLTYRQLLSIDSMLGDQQSALVHYRKYVQLLDSNYKATKIRQAEELQVIYETQEKETEINALNQQAKLEKANLKQTKLVKDLTIAGIIAVAIIAILLYRQNRLRKKSNKVITAQNEQLQFLLSDKERLLADKEWLLKEIHHRVKNNLQIIMSLLDSQSVYISDNAALTAINDSQRRVQAISLIHQMLYQSENTSSINMRRYADELVSYLKDSFDSTAHIVVEQDIEPVNLDVSKAIPLGLIINEGIVNAIKYAYPNQQTGIIHISLKYEDADHLKLIISDNGVGLPAGFEVMKQDSLGFSLMQGLTRQLEGTINIESHAGLRISILFSTLNDQSYE